VIVAHGPCGIADITSLRAEGGSGNYEWTVLSGQLPPDLALLPSGEWGGRMDWDWVYEGVNLTAEILVTDLADGSTAQNTVIFEGRTVGYAGDSRG
jgi:hypothetical protein